MNSKGSENFLFLSPENFSYVLKNAKALKNFRFEKRCKTSAKVKKLTY
jgi:hypothetical protein